MYHIENKNKSNDWIQVCRIDEINGISFLQKLSDSDSHGLWSIHLFLESLHGP